MTWNDERVEVLKNLHADGWTSRQIAARLGVTRCAVCGKLARLGLTREKPAPRTASRARRAPRPTAATQKGAAPKLRARDEQGILPALPLPPPALEDVARIATLDLEPWHCRWAVGDPIEVGPHSPLFCGDRKLPGLPYCQVHAARAYNRPAVAELEPVLVPAPPRELEPAA